MKLPARSQSPVAVALGLAFGLAFALGLAAMGCGPKQKFCPDAGDGVCPTPMDAAPVDTYEAPSDRGSIYIDDAGVAD